LKITLRRLASIRRSEEIEIIVVNDGLDDGTEQVVAESNLPYKYFFTGQRHENGVVRRNPGVVHNIGVRNSDSDFIIITSPEIYLWDDCSLSKTIEATSGNRKALVTPSDVVDDQDGYGLFRLRNGHEVDTLECLMSHRATGPFVSNRYMPYWMGMWRSEFELIGGYDEDLTGTCSDDNDLVDRLLWNGCSYLHENFYAVHLYHPKPDPDSVLNDPLYKFNLDVRASKGRSIVRNAGRVWGKL